MIPMKEHQGVILILVLRVLTCVHNQFVEYDVGFVKISRLVTTIPTTVGRDFPETPPDLLTLLNKA